MNSAEVNVAVPGLSTVSVADQYRALLYRRWLLLAALGLTVLILVATDLTICPAAFGLTDVLGGLFNPETLSKAQAVIL